MTWHTLKPANQGGGRRPEPPKGKVYPDGQTTISHEACRLLGWPDKVIVRINPDERKIRLTPTTPDDVGGFMLSGGGNSPHRLRMMEAVKRWPELIGEYAVWRIAGGIELRQAAADQEDENGELEI